MAMLNMHNQKSGDSIQGLFEDKRVTEMVMSRVDWIIILREIFYELIDNGPSGA